ncbi:hypothetical protein NK553_12505 [Pseudomonas sp. ZM23]|uniref:Uncharacterized protein n=1 Tax=Pseudomonas triclosanedens TaxID=2961893 RepID=A0ABY7A2W1_9PSED|nr:hypothetical protein [Pseudomonas triclosanedens]MCP8464770.1 hypothetical protein [Pseudomonas triclosanedens]MCP8470517.1 hypothetical protein [Pseudomonas triclosanedens]MCP8476323.1 hypothetical protein [Pseudomonas triclosanedens]WAI51448.1 hypothetical protein OU419_09425 [Pseudomonas triclosanedens]
MLKKTLLGAAIASAMFAGAANAGVVNIIVGASSNASVTQNSPGEINQYASGQANYVPGSSIETGASYGSRAANITIAQEIFGNLSESTQFDLPDLDYAIDPAKAVNAAVGHTIKLTLDRTVAQFANVISANQIQIGTLPAGTGFTITSGIGINTLSLTLDAAGAAEIQQASVANPAHGIVHFLFRTNGSTSSAPAKIDHLRAALQGDATFVAQSFNPNVSLLSDPLNERRFEVTVSAQLDTTTGANALNAINNDSAAPFLVFTSLPAVYWDVLNTNSWGSYQVLNSLNLANQDKNFDPNVSVQAGASDPANYGANFQRLGSIRLGVNPDVLNEDGRNIFGFNGSDKISSYISGNFAGVSSIALVNNSCSSYANGNTTAAYSWDAAAITKATGSDGVAKLSVELKNADVNQTYNICAVASGTSAMAAQQTFNVGPLRVDFGNVRYVDRVINGGQIDHFWKSSCVASLFNLPAGNNQDAFFVRLTNTSDDGRSGKVRGVLYDQNGKRYPATGSAYIVDSSGKATLKAHETGVYSVKEVASAFGVNGNDWNGVNGRARLIMEGEFPTCEALGLIRTPNGTLVNMTSTTQGNFNGNSGPSTTVNHEAGNNRN